MNYNNDHIVILVCDNIPNQKFWNQSISDWDDCIDNATVYASYGDTVHCIWKIIPKEKVTHRITSSNKYLYNLMYTGKWDGYSALPDIKE